MRTGELFPSLFPPPNISGDFPVSPGETTSAPSPMPPKGAVATVAPSLQPQSAAGVRR